MPASPMGPNIGCTCHAYRGTKDDMILIGSIHGPCRRPSILKGGELSYKLCNDMNTRECMGVFERWGGGCLFGFQD